MVPQITYTRKFIYIFPIFDDDDEEDKDVDTQENNIKSWNWYNFYVNQGTKKWKLQGATNKNFKD